MSATVISTHPPVTFAEVAGLAVPAAITALLQNAYRPLDQFYVGYLGGHAQGALGATIFVLIVVYAGFICMSAGAGPLVARFHGAGDEESQREAVGAALVGAAGVAVLLVAAAFVAVEPVVWMLGLAGPIADHAAIYLRTIFLTGGALAFSPTIDAAFASRGNTWLPMLVQGGVLAINAAITPILLFVVGMGVEGAALGTTVAQTLGVTFSFWLLTREMGLRRRHLRAGPMLRRVVNIGLPIAWGTAFYALVYWALLATSISPLGPDVNAGLGVGFSGLEAFSWPLYLGITVAIASIVGRRLGMGDVQGAKRAVRLVAVPQIGIGVGVALIFYFAGPSIVSIFAADEAVYRQAVIYAVALSWSQPAVAVEALAEGVLAGAGDTKKVFWGTVPFNLLRVPLAWFMAFPLGWGPLGVWWAINITSFIKGAVKGAMVWEGSWAKKGL